jgi:glycosyltransferase involved in cell wall biosynthesis
MNTSPPDRIVITLHHPLGAASGGARMTREIARHIGKLGAEVIIITVSSMPYSHRFPRQAAVSDDEGYQFDAELAQDSVRVIRLPRNPLSRWLDGLAVRRTVVKLMAERPLTAVLSYFQEGAFLPGYLQRHGVINGQICTLQSYDAALTKGALATAPQWIIRRFVLQPLQQSEALFATSQFTASELVKTIGVDLHKVHVTYLGVAPHFAQVPRSATPPKSRAITRLLFFGRLVADKGVVDALRALGQLATRGVTNWELRIFGLGDIARLRHVAQKQGIGDKVFVGKPLEDAALHAELAQAHLALLPSHFEAFGLAFAESQAAALPVIAYAAGSVPEVVVDGVTGWLAPVHDIDALANCIEAALNDPAKSYQMGLAGRERSSQHFTWEKTAAAIMNGLQERRQ